MGETIGAAVGVDAGASAGPICCSVIGVEAARGCDESGLAGDSSAEAGGDCCAGDNDDSEPEGGSELAGGNSRAGGTGGNGAGGAPCETSSGFSIAGG